MLRRFFTWLTSPAGIFVIVEERGRGRVGGVRVWPGDTLKLRDKQSQFATLTVPRRGEVRIEVIPDERR